MQVCTSLQTDNHASTPPLSFLQTQPTVSKQTGPEMWLIGACHVVQISPFIMPSSFCRGTTRHHAASGNIRQPMFVMNRLTGSTLLVLVSVLPTTKKWREKNRNKVTSKKWICSEVLVNSPESVLKKKRKATMEGFVYCCVLSKVTGCSS